MSSAKSDIPAVDPEQDNNLNKPSHEDDVITHEDATTTEEDVATHDEDDITSEHLYARQRRRGFLMLVLYFLVALAFAVLVVFFGRWVYHRLHRTTKPVSTTTSQSAPSAPTQPSAPSNNSNSGSPSANSTRPSSPSNQSNPSNSTNPNGGVTQTPNTGPGNVVAIFVATAILVGGLHFVYGLRRA